MLCSELDFQFTRKTILPLLLFLLFFSNCFYVSGFYQNSKELDNLIHSLELRQKEDTVKLSLYNSIFKIIKNDNEMAYDYAKKGYELGKKFEPTRLVAVSTYQYAKVLQIKGEHLKAAQIIEDQVLNFENQNQTPPPFLFHQLGKIYDETGNKVKALNSYLKAFELWKTYKQPLLTKEDFYESIANLYIESGQYKEAQYYYEELLKWANSDQNKGSANQNQNFDESKKIQSTAAQGLVRIFIAKQEYKQALLYLQKSEEILYGEI